MSLKTDYINEIRKQLGYWPTWLPGSPLEPGTIGLIDKGTFRQVTTLNNKKLIYETIKNNKLDFDYKSQGGVSIQNKLSGQLPIDGSSLLKADAGILVNFSKKNAVVLKTKGLQYELIEDIDSIGKLIVDLYKQRQWQDGWVVVTEVLHAQSATILISRNSKSKLELKASLKSKSKILDIADAGIDFQMISNKGLETTIIAKSGITVGFRLWGIKKHLLGEASFKPKELTFNQIPQDEFEVVFGEII